MGRSTNSSSKKKPNAAAAVGQKLFDDDAAVFIDMSNELKEEGNKLFQKRDYENALLKYEKSVTLLPKTHPDVAHLRSNIAACYMQMNPPEYHRAIDQCNLALEVSPKYSKALLKRAKCFESVNKLEFAFKDVNAVLQSEPNNLTALEISQRINSEIEKKGVKLDGLVVNGSLESNGVVKEKKSKKKKGNKTEDKVVVNEEKNINEVPPKNVKLVFGEDIRWAQLPDDCTMLQLRDVVRNKFPGLKSVLVKYKDKEGDLVTITTQEELRWAEESADPHGSLRLYVAEVDPELDPFYHGSQKGLEKGAERYQNGFAMNGSVRFDEDKSNSSCVDDWIVQFARIFKNNVGFSSDGCLDLHELGVKVYAEALEDTVSSEEAQELFDFASDKFHEMAALALFNLGNVHMSRARRLPVLSDDMSRESLLDQAKSAYELAKEEYVKAGRKYEEALKIKPDFYEGLLALGQKQFEQAKLSWYYAIGSKIDLNSSWSSLEIIEILNNAEENIEKGMEIWEEMEEQRLKMLGKPSREKTVLQNVGLDGLLKDVSTDEAAELASHMRSQINILWGTILYQRSVIEFKLGIPVWQDCLVAAVEKFKLAGASPPDINVMIKNHCSNESAQEGLGFKIDEIVQAWNELYDAKKWISGVSSFRLEPLLRRRVPKLHHLLEHI